MQQENISFYDWQKTYSTREHCLEYIRNKKWPKGFICPHCQNNHGYFISQRHHYEYHQCSKI